MCNQPTPQKIKNRRGFQGLKEKSILLYRKGKLPEKLRMKKPAKGSIVRYKKNLTIDPSTIKVQEMGRVITHKTQNDNRVQFLTKIWAWI